jgi:spermidine/putrescine transport system permease protein
LDATAEALPRRSRRLSVGPLVLTAPAAAGLLVFFAAPLLVFVLYSFLTAGLFSVSTPFTFDAFREAVDSDLHRTLGRNSLVVGLLAATVTVAIGLPIAYWLRYASEKRRLLVLFLITASLFASYLVRIYAWRTVLGQSGVLNEALDGLGLIDRPLDFLLYNRFSVTVALVHIFLPYVVLVLYAGFGPLTPALLETAQDLGANSLARWRRVILPLVAAPAVTAFVFVFILSASDYVTPQLIGGTDGVMLGVQIQANFKAVGDWPLGAATSLLMLLAFVLLYGLTTLALRIAKLDRIRWVS